jgi:hypothetical protein
MPQPEQPAPSIQARIQGASTLPEMLAASFDAFEIIRRVADSCVDEVPELFAAFMTTAGAAVNGREAITAAPSLPPGSADLQGSTLAANASLEESMSALANLGELLASRLSKAAGTATVAADRMVCEEAAEAARQIRHLMARDNDAPGFW